MPKEVQWQPLEGQAERADVAVVPVGVVAMVAGGRRPVRLLVQPAPHLGGLARRIIDVGRHQVVRRERVRRRVESRRGRIEPLEGFQLPELRLVGEVGLGQDDAVGDRRLLDRFGFWARCSGPLMASTVAITLPSRK